MSETRKLKPRHKNRNQSSTKESTSLIQELLHPYQTLFIKISRIPRQCSLEQWTKGKTTNGSINCKLPQMSLTSNVSKRVAKNLVNEEFKKVQGYLISGRKIFQSVEHCFNEGVILIQRNQQNTFKYTIV